MTAPDIRKTVVAGAYAVAPYTFNTGPFEFAKVVTECEEARLIAPSRHPSKFRRAIDKSLNAVSWTLGQGNRPSAAPAAMEEDCDLFVFGASWPHEAAELRRLQGWRRRSRLAVAFINEWWPNMVSWNRPHYAEMRQFDCIFIPSEQAADINRKLSGANVRYMPCGVDVETLTPFPRPPARVIDVYTMGRRPPVLTTQLAELAQNPDFLSLVDTAAGPFLVGDHRSHSINRAAIFKRAKFVPGFSLSAVDNAKAREANGLELTPLRFYEAAAAGANVFGVPPNTSDYASEFNWADACFPAHPADTDYSALAPMLLRDRERLARASLAAATAALRRFDWAHRWRAMLEALGLTPKPALEQREARLEALAADPANPALTLAAWQEPPHLAREDAARA